LLRLGSFTLLTDPNFARRGQWVHIGEGLVSRRRTEPALGLADLPELDGVILSHLHGDHFDRIARRGLRRDLPIFTTPHAAKKLRRTGFSETVPMKTWTEQAMSKAGEGLTLTSLPGKHAFGPIGAVLPPVMGTLVEYRRAPGEPPLRIYLTGDTLVHVDLRGIAQKWPDIDYAVVHLGGTRFAGMLLTMDGEQGVDLLEMIGPRSAIPVHYDDYGLFKSPLSDFRVEVDRRNPATTICYLHRGQTHELTWPAAQAVNLSPEQ
jgi:L-ascorbate metabolism protein UlaG (beta-lactamase superfamily)